METKPIIIYLVHPCFLNAKLTNLISKIAIIQINKKAELVINIGFFISITQLIHI